MPAATLIPPLDELEQGDILVAAPSVFVRTLEFMWKTGPNSYKLDRRPPPGDPANPRQENVREPLDWVEDAAEPGNAVGSRRGGLVLSHGCEIDKAGNKNVLVAHLRRLSSVHDDDIEEVTTYKRKRTFYLPATEGLLDDDMYADFRFITTVRADLISGAGLERSASLDTASQRLLQAQLFRYFVRKQLVAEWVDWPDEHDAEGED